MLQVLFTFILLSASAIAAPSQAQAQLQVAAQQRASDLDYSPIKSVTDETRYVTLNPGTKLDALDKVKHSKNNIVFSSCERITGDKLLVNNYDDESFTTAVDIEVTMRYPSTAGTGSTLTCIEIYVDTSANDAAAYFADGAIGQTTALVLLTCNQTRTFSYEAFFYGY